jgi:hypothetical protein
MLRQVLLGLSNENDMQRLANREGVQPSFSDCRPFNSKGYPWISFVPIT